MSQDKLARLIEELREHRFRDAPEREAAYESALEDALLAAGRLCLVHGVGPAEKLLAILKDRRLKTGEELGRARLDHEEKLNLPSMVYLGVGRLHPGRRSCLVFSATLEDEVSVEASPWDLGSFRKWCGESPEGTAALKANYERFTLSSPYYREYLGHYVASCFANVPEYLEGRKWRWKDPLGALEAGRPLLRCFEARTHQPIGLASAHLAAIFVRRASRLGRGNDPLEETLQEFERAGVEVVRFNASEAPIQRQVRNWQQSRLSTVGTQA